MMKNICLFRRRTGAVALAAGLVLVLPQQVDAQWAPPVFIQGFTLPYNNARGLARGEKGLLHVVSGGYPNEIFYTRSVDNGTTWSAMRQISADDGAWENCPAVAGGGSYVHTVWENEDGSLYYRRSTDGGATWLAQINLSGHTPWAHMPSIAVSGPNVHVVWADRRWGGGPGSWLIFYRHSTDNGATWNTGDSLCHATTSADEADPRPSVSASDDNVYVIWQDFRDQYISHEIYFTRSTDNGENWSSGTRLTEGAFSYYWMPFATLASSGSNVHIVWEDVLGDTSWIFQYLTYMRSTDRGATWSSWVKLSPDTLMASMSTVTAKGSQIYVACWAYAYYQGRYGLYFRRSTDAGATWIRDTLFLVPVPDSLGGYFYPSIAVSDVDTMIHTVGYASAWGIGYFRYGNPAIGIEADHGSTRGRLSRKFEVVPNPFSSFAVAAGHDNARLVVYSITGQRISSCRGDRIGENLSPGVYFLKSEKDGEAVRIVKVR